MFFFCLLEDVDKTDPNNVFQVLKVQERKYTYLLTCPELDEKIDTTLMSINTKLLDKQLVGFARLGKAPKAPMNMLYVIYLYKTQSIN